MHLKAHSRSLLLLNKPLLSALAQPCERSQSRTKNNRCQCVFSGSETGPCLSRLLSACYAALHGKYDNYYDSNAKRATPLFASEASHKCQQRPKYLLIHIPLIYLRLLNVVTPLVSGRCQRCGHKLTSL